MDQGLAIVLAGALAAVPGILTFLQSRANKVTIDDVHKQVATLNESTVGQLAAAVETRRVEAIPHDERTAKEERHVESAPPLGPPIGPSE